METELTVTERFAVVTSLEHGPWRLAGLNDEPLGVRRFSDGELEAHWRGWARAQCGPNGRRTWNTRDWAVRVFELQESPVEAFRHCRELRRRAPTARRRRGRASCPSG